MLWPAAWQPQRFLVQWQVHVLPASFGALREGWVGLLATRSGGTQCTFQSPIFECTIGWDPVVRSFYQGITPGKALGRGSLLHRSQGSCPMAYRSLCVSHACSRKALVAHDNVGSEPFGCVCPLFRCCSPLGRRIGHVWSSPRGWNLQGWL